MQINFVSSTRAVLNPLNFTPKRYGEHPRPKTLGTPQGYLAYGEAAGKHVTEKYIILDSSD